MNKFFFIVCTYLLITSPSSLVAATKIDGIVAIVEAQPILSSDLKTRFSIIKDRVPGGVMTDNVRRQVLTQMVEEVLQANYAEKLGIHVNNQELSDAILNIAAGMNLDISGLKTALTKQGVDYPRYRSQIKNEILIGKLKGQIIRQRISITEQEIDDFLNSEEALATNKDQVRLRHILLRSGSKDDINNLKNSIKSEQGFIDQAIAKSNGSAALQGGDIGWKLINQLPLLFANALKKGQGPIFGPIESSAGQHLLWLVDKKVSKGNLQEQTKVRHILLSKNAIRNNEQTKKVSESLYRRLQNGEDFALLAKEFSDDNGSALKGGDLNWVTLGSMVPEFEKTMVATRVGKMSQPFESQFGWHILLVEGRRNTDISDKVQRINAEKALTAQKQDIVLSQWLAELKAQAFIELK